MAAGTSKPRIDTQPAQQQRSKRIGCVIIFALLPCPLLSAVDKSWALDSPNSSEATVRGEVSLVGGVKGGCLVFDGNALLKLKDSQLTNVRTGFTLLGWVNPYLLNGQQQIIAAKNRYSRGERQWSLMIDKDDRFRLYVYQGRWVTTVRSPKPKLGHWHLIGMVVAPDKAELWVNGQLAGQVKLTKPIPHTIAPLTLGGVDDSGRIRQTFVGALDEFQLFDRPFNNNKMTAAYTPVAATHAIPKRPSPYTIWTGPRLPNTSKAETVKGVKFHVIKKHEPRVDGYGFLHGVAIAWHKEKLYASFAHNKGSENTFTEEGRYRISEDGGKSWSKTMTIDVGTDDKDLAVSHGVFLSHAGTLWAFLGSFHGTRKRVHTRAYTLDEKAGKWTPQGTVIQGGFWPMTEPVKMADGNWIMPGFIVGQRNPAAVAISNGDDLTKWKTVILPLSKRLGRVWGESSIIVDGSRITNIARYGDKPLALVATSNDFGRTWTESTESNLPMVASKPCAGVLSTGQRYLICSTTADGGNRRSPLTIALSKRGETTFSKVFVIRHAVFKNGPGESHPSAALSYPYAVEHRGMLYVGYSNNGPRRGNNNSAELAVIPIDALKAGAK